jgi:hypothetical protein
MVVKRRQETFAPVTLGHIPRCCKLRGPMGFTSIRLLGRGPSKGKSRSETF